MIDPFARTRGEQRAAKAMLLLQSAPTGDISGVTGPPVPGEVRPDRWATCPVCGAPSIDPLTGRCEMASCTSTGKR